MEAMRTALVLVAIRSPTSGPSSPSSTRSRASISSLPIDGGKPTDIEIPLDVMRFEPLRKRH